jgi:hypothetical protein
MSIKRDNARRVFVLEVKGLPVRYYSGPAPTTMATHIDTASEIAFTDVRAITDVSHYQAELDPSGGVAEYSPITVTLAMDKKRGDSNNPHVIFERCGLRSNITKAKIESNISHTDAPSFTLDVDTSLTSLSYPRIMHIGAESVKVSSATVSTLTISERGIGGTPKQAHVIQNEGISTPEITTEITTFRGRRASLWVAVQYKDGSVGSYTELINGFIESSPIGDGKTITITLLPIIALIDSNVLPRNLTTSLTHDYHYFDSDRASTLEYMVTNVELFRASADISTSANTVDFPEGGYTLETIFDITMTNSDGDKLYYHPRHASFFRTNEQVFAEAYRDPNGNSQNQGFSYDDNMGEITPLPDRVINGFTVRTPTLVTTGHRREMKRVTLTSGQVVQWPLVLRDAIESAVPSSASGLSGAWGHFTLMPRGDQFELLLTSHVYESIGCAVEFWTSTETYRTSLTGEFDPTVIDGHYWQGGGGYPEWHLPDFERLWYGFDFQSIESDEYPQEPILPQEFNQTSRGRGRGGYSRFENSNGVNSSIPYRVRGAAKGFYQLFEKSILVKESLGLPTSAGSSDFTLKVEYYDRQAGETKTQYLKVTHQTAVSYGGTPVGYRIHLKGVFNRENRSFGDWAQFPPCVLSLADSYSSLSANEVLLRILQNGGGGGINGDYDLGSVGLNLSADDIDLISFEQFTNLNGLASFEGDVDNTVNLRDVVDPVLKSMGACMVMRRDATGKSKIALVPIGLEQTEGALGSFTDTSHIYTTPAPLSLVYEDIVTAIFFKYDYQDGDYQKEVIVNNSEAITRFNEEQRKIDLDLRGVSSNEIGNTYQEILNFFKPVFGRIFRLLSNPLRLWRFSVGTGASIDCDLGSYYKITSDHLKGYGDEYGISNGIGMVRSISQGLMSEGADLEFIHLDSKVVGWHDSALVSSIIDADTVEVNANTYSLYNQLGQSTVDASWFSVGDKVLYFEIANQATTTSLTISEVSGNQLTFTANHGISGGGGIITPDVASLATSSQLEQAYLADSSTGLLNNTLTPQEYV